MNILRFLIHIANYIQWERGKGLSLSPSQEEGTVMGVRKMREGSVLEHKLDHVA